MALSDPQSITIGSETISFARTGMGPNSSTYRGTTENGSEIVLQVTQNEQRSKTRHSIRIDRSEFVSDPIVPSNNIRASDSVTLVIETPRSGSTLLESAVLLSGFLSYLTASSNAVSLKVLAGEV